MEKSKVDTFILNNSSYFASESIPVIRMMMEQANDSKWHALSCVTFKDPQTALMISIFGGPIGIDRFYIGQNLLGAIKTITCGGLLVWAFIDQFLIKGATYRYNYNQLLNALNTPTWG